MNHQKLEQPLRLALLANRYNELSNQLEEAAAGDPALQEAIEIQRGDCLTRMAHELGYAPADPIARAAILAALNDPATFHRWKALIAVLGEGPAPR